MSVGLVLEGGAMRGMYTAGVLDIFLDNDIKIDGIVGVSAGALFGVNYASGQRGRVIRYNKKYAADKRYMGFRSWLKTGNIINCDFAYYEVPLSLDPFDDEAFQKSGIDYYATVTNVETGRPEYIKVENTIRQLELFRATSAMPFFSEIIEYEGKKYLDGGVSDSIPVEKCRELGYDKITVVLTRPLEYRKKKHSGVLAKIKYSSYPNLADAINSRYARYNETLDKVAEMEARGEIFVIRPSRTVDITRVEKDVEKLQEMYDLGVHDCESSIAALRTYLESR